MANEVESQGNDSISPETQEVLNQLVAEGHTLEGSTPPEQKVPEAPVQAPKEPEAPVLSQEIKEEPSTPVDRAPREPALIPAWEHKVAEKRWAKENETLRAELEALKANPTQANQQAVAQSALNLKELAQQNGLELDEAQEKFFSALIRNAVPQDVSKKLEALERDRQIAFLEAQYEQEFERDVLPVIRERYGELDGRTLAELKAKLHDTAFTETYAKVPLKKVFIAEETEFKLQRAEIQETVKATKSGKTRSQSVDYDAVDEETFARMSPEDVEKYQAHMIEKEGGRKWR